MVMEKIKIKLKTLKNRLICKDGIVNNQKKWLCLYVYKLALNEMKFYKFYSNILGIDGN